MLSTPSLSTPRGTATGSTPQFTASVVKYQCLFTHDLRRKSKRWQDGCLRYHAFNKRIMVYDEQGNFVGDHHWRSTEEVIDGDEFELDKGVLVQVGERMSTTQTDISNLFEKRRSSQTSPQSKDSGPQPPRSSTVVRSSASSQPFRSLNDLLGIKRTPIGHLVSPYEERHRAPQPSSILQPSEPERAPKRQKVAVPERHLMNRHKENEVIDLTKDGQALAKSRDSASVQDGSRPQNAPRPSTRLPPGDKPGDRPPKTTGPSHSPTIQKPPTPSRPVSSGSHPAQSTARVTTGPTRPGDPELRSPSPPSNHQPPLSRRVASDSISKAPTMPWRMPIQRSRNKLLYPTLLSGGGLQRASTALPKPTTEKRKSPPLPKSRDSQ